MLTHQPSQRDKRRFRVEPVPPVPPVQPPRGHRGPLPVRVVVARRRNQRRFRVEPIEARRQMRLPVALVIERRHPRRRRAARAVPATATTLARRRQLRRRALFASLACVVLAGVVGVLVFTPLIHSQSKNAQLALSADTGGAAAARNQIRQDQATQPFTLLQTHVSANAAQPPAVQAAAAFLFDPDHGWVLYQKNADTERPIASLTKVMTLLVAVDAGDLGQAITVGPDAAALVVSGNSYMGVSTGEQLPLRDLLFGLIVGSGNDAAVAIADGMGGTEASFVTLMNNRARRLGLTHTFFVSPDGLDDGNRSTARDLAILAAVALEQPGVEQITATRHDAIPQTATHKAFDLLNSNDLLPGGLSPYPGATGVKTGYTDGAQYCMAFSAVRQGHQLVGVVLGDPSAQARLSDAHALLDWGFTQE